MNFLTARSHHAGHKTTFTVDNVIQSDERYPTTTALARMERQTGAAICALSHQDEFELVADEGHQPLISAVHLAFSRHHPLALSPDDIWITIAQGFAQHINNNSSELRSLLVKHDGKLELAATTKSLLAREEWEILVGKWAAQTEANVAPELQGLMVCDFSTTTPTSRAASQVVLMDAMQQYFDYLLVCICGIPSITLYGSVEDWQSIRDRVACLARFNLSWWTNRLLPICDQFVATAQGRPSQYFWQKIYKPKGRYGGDVVTGWIADLFPYILHWTTHAPTVRNPMLSQPQSKLTVRDGIHPKSFPTGLSSAPVTVKFDGNADRRLHFLGGFIGATQDPESGCMRPEIGWAVQVEDAFDSVLRKLATDHDLHSPEKPIDVDPMKPREMPADIFHMLTYFDGGELYPSSAHAWKVRKFADYTSTYATDRHTTVTSFLDLNDGRQVGFLKMSFYNRENPDGEKFRSEWWIIAGMPNCTPDVCEPGQITFLPDIEFPRENIKVIAIGLSQFFERIVKSNGQYYFDNPEFVPDADFSSLD